ncbi:MAG: T9SS type A sorting domain-containing protein [Schleiferiaceae bacterium]
MKRTLLLLSFVFTVAGLNAQSLAVHEMDTVLEVNSTAMADYGFSIDIKNVSATDVDVYVRRAYHEMDCAFDSGYFCWDYCYGSEIDSSIGYINIQPGVVKGDFSGHVYSPTTGSSCTDSTRYVFYNGKDNSDSLSVWVTISAGPTVGTIELSVAESKVYPNPAVNVLHIETQKAGTFTLFNTLGEEVKRTYLVPGQNAVSVADCSNGIYLYSIDGSTFKRVVINH